MHHRQIELHDEDDELLCLDVYFYLDDDFEIESITDEENVSYIDNNYVVAYVTEVILRELREAEEERKYELGRSMYEEKYFQENGRLP